MTWYYAEAGKQLGPLEDSEFEALVQAGRIQPDTLVWHEGLANWQPLRQVRATTLTTPPASSEPQGPAPPQEGGLMCSECGRGFAPDQVIQLEGRFVCSNCKPVVVQRLKEGASRRVSPPMEPDALINFVRERDYQCDLGAYLNRSWALLKSNFWLAVGTTLLVLMCEQGPGVVPLVGPLLAMLLTGPLNGGLYGFYLKLIRGQPARLADGFAGFGPHFWHLMLAACRT